MHASPATVSGLWQAGAWFYLSAHTPTATLTPILNPPQLLGAMAHCAPKQLGSCLPVVVPRLGDVLADPHPKVASAARTALNEVGSVIRNPEVAKLVPVLLAGGWGWVVCAGVEGRGGARLCA